MYTAAGHKPGSSASQNLVTLESMGFDRARAAAALEASNDDLDQALEALMSRQPQRNVSSSLEQQNPNLPLLTSMGFDQQSAKEALEACSNDMDRALERLLKPPRAPPRPQEEEEPRLPPPPPVADAPSLRKRELSEVGKRLFQHAAHLSFTTSQDRHNEGLSTESISISKSSLEAEAGSMAPHSDEGPESVEQLESIVAQKVQEMMENMKQDPFFNGWGDLELQTLAERRVRKQINNGPDKETRQPPSTSLPPRPANLRQQRSQMLRSFREQHQQSLPQSSTTVPSWKARDSAAAMRPQARAAQERLQHQEANILESRSEVATCGSSDHVKEDIPDGSGMIWSPSMSECNSPAPNANPSLGAEMSQTTLEAFDIYSAMNPKPTAQLQVAKLLQMISTAAAQGLISDETKTSLKARVVQGENIATIQQALETKINQNAPKPQELDHFTEERLAQDAEYEESLRIDRLKAAERKRKAEEEERERRRKLEAEAKAQQEYQAYIDTLRQRLPQEPAARHPGSKRVRFVMPSGQKIERRFLGSHTIQDIHDFVELWFHDEGEEDVEFEVVTSYPRIVLRKHRSTLDEQGFGANTILYIQNMS